MAFVQSDFYELSLAGLDPVVVALQETFNGENAVPSYRFRNGLAKRYSFDGTWKSLGFDNGLIAADIVALDSPLPIKERPAISQATGEAFKIGTELSMNETDLKQLRLLYAAGNDTAQAQSMYFRNTRRVYGGVLEQIEYRYLQGLSQGFFVAQANGVAAASQNNVGLSLRADFGYQNLYNASVVWGTTGYTALGDLVALQNAASDNGAVIIKFMMDNATKNQLLQSPDAANFVANYAGYQNNGGAPTMTRLNEALQGEYGFTIEVVNRAITTQINGVKTTQNPWAAGQVIGVTQEEVGTLVWSDVEENNSRSELANYAVAEDFILISQYRTIRPSLKEWTASQAVASPVINASVVYKLDTTAIA